MKSFNEWYTKINEEIAEPVATAGGSEATIDTSIQSSDRDVMLSDIDTIMTSLETLAGELSESLNEDINEADTEIGALTQGAVATGAAVGVAAAFAVKKIKAMKAKKNQKKANAMLMRVEVAKIKARDIEDPNAKKAVNSKIESMEAQADQLQQTIDKRYGDETMSSKAIQSEKLKGQIERVEFLAKETGSTKYQKQLAKLNQRYKDTVAAMDEVIKKAKEEADSAKKSEKSTETEEAPEETKDQVDKNSKQGKMDRLDALLKKAEESGDEEKIQKVKSLKDKVAAKESWQIENTELGMLIESEIIKLETEFLLNESVTLSIKERFSKLI